MSSSDAQPPLSRREARERERAAAAGGQPVTPPPTVAAPSDQPESRRRPGSHVAPSPSGPARSAVRPASGSTDPAPQQGPVFPLAPAPASATEIVPGTGGLTRRQLRLMREAEGQAVQPVPLQAPTPQSSDRTVQDVIGSVDHLEQDTERPRPASADTAASARSAQVPLAATPVIEASAAAGASGDAAPAARDTSADDTAAADTTAADAPEQEPAEADVLDPAAVAQATEADGSPDAIEPLSEAAAHAEEPRRHRTTWAPPENDDTGADDTEAPDADDDAAQEPAPAPTASTPVVFPLSLDDDTNEVPVQRPTPATARRSDDGTAAGATVPAVEATRTPMRRASPRRSGGAPSRSR